MILASVGTVLITLGIVTTCVLLIGLILLQKNRGSGLSGAFGGVGGHTAFGTKTGDFLTWVTVSLTAVFLLLSIIGNYVFDPDRPVTASQPPPVTPVSTPTEGSVPPSGEISLPITPASPPVDSSSPAPAQPSQESSVPPSPPPSSSP